MRAGEVLAAARRRAGLSQRRLGERTGYSQATISRIERGRGQANDVRVLRHLADELGVPPQQVGLSPVVVEESWALEVLRRVEASDAGTATLLGMHAVADRLCRDYPSVAAPDLHVRASRQLEAVVRLLDGRLTLAQHREALVVAGWLALLAGCLDYDMGRRAAAEVTRRVAGSLGAEAGHSDIVAWSREMAAWFAVTEARYRGTVDASRAGTVVQPAGSVAVQLAAQEAKGWARLGDHRQVEATLERGHALLDRLPSPAHPEHHFVIDPTKWDFYAMDCYRVVGDDAQAEAHAQEVLRLHTDVDGNERAPMRMAEAHITLGVVAARRGELERAAHDGGQGLTGRRKSLPSLLLPARELASELRSRYPREQATHDYVERLRALRRS
ncbi:MAG: helix-turn-helix domain-containing protein [Carbonactinosporaceae bacterium]